MLDNKTKGALLMVMGTLIFVWGIKDLVMPIILACLGIYMVIYGMRLRGTSPMQIFMQTWMRRF